MRVARTWTKTGKSFQLDKEGKPHVWEQLFWEVKESIQSVFTFYFSCDNQRDYVRLY